MIGRRWLRIQFSIVCTLALAIDPPVLPAMAQRPPSAALMSSAVFPVTAGSEWVFRDTTGETSIRVAAREPFAGIDCYRVDWTGVVPFQSEYWQVKGDGIYVVGRRVMGRVSRFATPYLLLRHKLIAGDSWDASVSSESFSETLKFTVGGDEEVATPAGRFRATPVTVRGKAIVYRRWYAKGVGLVREETLLPDGCPLDEKKLIRRVE